MDLLTLSKEGVAKLQYFRFIMIFLNRSKAGQDLAEKLLKYKTNPEAIVLGLPRGGVVTAYEIALALGLPLDVICARKVGAPRNMELAIGAVTEYGGSYFNEDLILRLGISETYLKQTIETERLEANRRAKAYRKNLPKIDLKNKIVILADDGIATGATMKASIKSAYSLGASKVVVAIPVAPPESIAEIEQEVDDVVVLFAPFEFYAVGEFYKDFSQTSDEEVIKLLSSIHKVKGK
jgi:putative phosphoribosyl transferase